MQIGVINYLVRPEQNIVTIDNIFLYGYETAARARTFSNEDLGYLQVLCLQKKNCLLAIDFAVTILFEFFIAFS